MLGNFLSSKVIWLCKMAAKFFRHPFTLIFFFFFLFFLLRIDYLLDQTDFDHSSAHITAVENI